MKRANPAYLYTKTTNSQKEFDEDTSKSKVPKAEAMEISELQGIGLEKSAQTW